MSENVTPGSRRSTGACSRLRLQKRGILPLKQNQHKKSLGRASRRTTDAKRVRLFAIRRGFARCRPMATLQQWLR